MHSMKFLLDGFALVLIALCFGINLSEISIPWIITGFGTICLELAFSVRNATWCLKMPRWLLNTLALGVIAVTVFRINWDNAVNVLLECFICLTAIKWIERQKVRDYLQILALCLFALVSHAFFTFGMAYLFTVMATMIIATSALVVLTGFAELENQNHLLGSHYKLPLSWLFGFSFVFLVVSLPLSFFLFFILPRTETPFLAFLNREQVSYSGFSNVVELGSVEKIQEDETVAFRAIVQDIPPKTPMYWRGIVYDSFDGHSWKSSAIESHSEASRAKRGNSEEPPSRKKIPHFARDDSLNGSERPNTKISGFSIPQTVIMESSGHKFLFCLDIPISVKGLSKWRVGAIQDDQVFVVDRPVDRRVRYECVSVLGTYEMELSEREWEHYTAIPENWDSESPIRRLVQEIVGSSKDQTEIAWKFVNWLKSSPFQYAASELPLSNTALEDFLLKIKRGNCEYFASALAVMLRMAGIPARLVGGYYGGYFHTLGSYYLVLQKNAHVWVEAFFGNLDEQQHAGKGRWIRLDPTPLPPDFERRVRLSLWFRIRLALDFVQYSWNRLVVQYDVKEQEKIAKKMGEKVFRMRESLAHLKNLNLAEVFKMFKNFIAKERLEVSIIFAVFVLFAGVALLVRTYGYRRAHGRLLRDFEQYFGSKASARQPYETLREWFLRIENNLDPADRDRGRAFVEIYERCLYGSEGFSEENIKQLKKLLSS